MSDTLSLELIPGYTFPEDGSVVLTYELLNLLGRPTVSLTGTIGTLTLADGSVTVVKLANAALAASATGRAKMQDAFFSADATGRAKFVAGFFGAGDATSLALFADNFITAAKVAASICPVIGESRNLIVQYATAATLTISVDEIVLKNASSKPYNANITTGAPVTVNIAAAAGVNALDTGAEAASTWYYIFVIYDGTTVAGLLSTSSTAPTMPAGYTYKALVGAVRNDGSSNFITFYQRDRRVSLNDTVVFTAKAGATSWTAISGADLTAFQGLIPPIATYARGNMGNTASGAGMGIAADASALDACLHVSDANSTALLSYQMAGIWEVPLKTAQTVYYRMTGTSSDYRLSVRGYTI